MKKTKWKGGALIAPLPPVMVSCGTPEQPNVLTVAWTGIIYFGSPYPIFLFYYKGFRRICHQFGDF